MSERTDRYAREREEEHARIKKRIKLIAHMDIDAIREQSAAMLALGTCSCRAPQNCEAPLYQCHAHQCRYDGLLNQRHIKRLSPYTYTYMQEMNRQWRYSNGQKKGTV